MCIGVYGRCCGSIVAKKLASLGRSSTRFHLDKAWDAGDDASIFFSGPVEAEGGTSVAAPAGWLFWNIMGIHSLVKKTLHRHRAGFEPQRASSFMKRVKIFQILGEAVRA